MDNSIDSEGVKSLKLGLAIQLILLTHILEPTLHCFINAELNGPLKPSAFTLPFLRIRSTSRSDPGVFRR